MAAVGMMSFPPRDSFQGYPQQYHAHYASRAQQDPAVMASSFSVNPHSTYAPTSQPQQQQQTYQTSTRSARSSHSPASEDGQKPSLPSISNLFGMVDGERSGKEHAAKNAQLSQNQQAQAQSQSQSQPQTQSYSATQTQTQISQQIQQSQPPPQKQQLLQQSQQVQEQHLRQQHFQHPPLPASQQASNAPRVEQAPHIVSYPPQEASNNQRAMIPPTPPMRTDSIGENTHSPSTISTGSSLSGQPYFVGSALNNVEADQQRAHLPQMHKRPSVPAHPQTSPYGTSPYATSAYSASPGTVSNSGSFYSPNQPGYPPGAIYTQRALPSSFPPQPHSAPVIPATNPWEHHHYIGPSAHSTFPQTQERYICPTCNKAFSRPSSLKIHSHSHTGEKPFKCPHNGCGKAFSVRSNMKRHERGCHTGNAGMMGPVPHMSQ